MRGSASTRPVACSRPHAVSSLRVVAALAMSIWPKTTCLTHRSGSQAGDLAVARQNHYM